MRLPQIVALLCDVLVEKDADAMSSALKCLETLVAWAPLKGYVTRDLLRTLVQLIDDDLRSKTFCGDAAARALDAILEDLIPPDIGGFIDEVRDAASSLNLTPSSRESSPSDEEVGGLFFDFESLEDVGAVAAVRETRSHRWRLHDRRDAVIDHDRRSAQVGALVLGLLRTLAAALDSYTDEEDQEDVLAATSELVSTFVELHVHQSKADFRRARRGTFELGRCAELTRLGERWLSTQVACYPRVLFSRAANPRTLRRNLRPWDTLVSYLGERETCPDALASGIVDVVVAFFRDRCLFEHNGEALADLQADDDSDREENEEAHDNDEI